MDYGTIIIGNGIAGITTARHLRKRSDTRIQVVSMETPYFFSRTALMYVYMGHMKFDHIKPYEDWFWEKNRIELVQAKVLKVHPKEKNILLDTGEELRFDKLVIASGSSPRYFGWPGQELKGVQGLFSAQDLALLEANTPAPFEKNHPTKEAVIVGGGLIGVELAEMLHTRGIQVSLLVREKYFWSGVLTQNEGELIGQHIASHGIKLEIESEMQSVLDDGHGAARAIRTKDGRELPCQVVGITTGVAPNISFLKDSGIELDKGVLVDDFLQTSAPDIYAAGDCAQLRNARQGRKPIEAVWYVGRMMGEVLGATLSGKEQKYLPGPWFNSAKFFDIEYQTYGTISAKPEAGEMQYFWKVEGKDKFITVAYAPETHKFLGINTFGIRMRHEYFNNALIKGMGVADVIGGIHIANFDAELSKKWYKDFQNDFETETGIALQKPSMLKSLLKR